MAGDSLVDALIVRQVVELLARRGVDTAALLAGLALDADALQGPEAQVSVRHEAALLEAAATALGDPFFGLHFAAHFDPRDAGLIGYLASSCASLGESLRIIEAYLPVLPGAPACRVGRDGAAVLLQLDHAAPELPGHRQIVELSCGHFLRFFRIATNRRLSPLQVEFRHPRDDREGIAAQAFGCPVDFARRRTALLLDPRHLELPLVSADARLPGGGAASAAIARELGMSPRTLARRLAAEGTSFSTLVERAREELARRYLREAGAPLGQIAYLLGYSETSAFTHAFRRWTGQSPSRFRAAAG